MSPTGRDRCGQRWTTRAGDEARHRPHVQGVSTHTQDQQPKPNEKRLLTSSGTRRKHWLPRRSGPRCCPSAPYMRTPERGTGGGKGSQGARRGGHKLLLIGSFDRRPTSHTPLSTNVEGRARATSSQSFTEPPFRDGAARSGGDHWQATPKRMTKDLIPAT